MPLPNGRTGLCFGTPWRKRKHALFGNACGRSNRQRRSGINNSLWKTKRRGETIYGTRGGDVVPHTWGVSTRKGDRLFIHILDLQDDALYIPLKAKVKKAIQFISKTPLSFKQEKDGIFIKLPQVPDDIDYVIELVIKQ